MTKTRTWIRVSRKDPCKVCGKPDWCGYTEEAYCCMRIRSDKPISNGGYLHRPNGYLPKPYIPIQKPMNSVGLMDLKPILSGWMVSTDPKRLISHSESIYVDPQAMFALGCCWSEKDRAWAFPMKDHQNKVVGIRFRNEKGDKWALKGSKQGIFYANLTKTMTFLVEGPTDTAAMLSMGLQTIGRPSCIGCEQIILDCLKFYQIPRIVIIPDNDDPGINGLERLKPMIKIPYLVWVPPCKDVRDFLRLGGTGELINSQIKNLVWNNPKL